MLWEIQVHASKATGTKPRICRKVAQCGGLFSAMSVLSPGMSTNYHLFLPQLLVNKMSYRQLSLTLSETNNPSYPSLLLFLCSQH